jgi:hypothetical protein
MLSFLRIRWRDGCTTHNARVMETRPQRRTSFQLKSNPWKNLYIQAATWRTIGWAHGDTSTFTLRSWLKLHIPPHGTPDGYCQAATRHTMRWARGDTDSSTSQAGPSSTPNKYIQAATWRTLGWAHGDTSTFTSRSWLKLHIPLHGTPDGYCQAATRHTVAKLHIE